MTDIVERLRLLLGKNYIGPAGWEIREAADEIERLRRALAESDQLIATHANSIDDGNPSTWPSGRLLAAAIKRHGERCARSALTPADDGKP